MTVKSGLSAQLGDGVLGGGRSAAGKPRGATQVVLVRHDWREQAMQLMMGREVIPR